MSRPYFAGTRDDVPRRGATSSKAGLDLPRRVAGLEQGIESVTPAGIMTTRGDIIRRGASVPERVALGADNTELRSNGTDPGWYDVPFQVISERSNRYAAGIGTNAFVLGHQAGPYYFTASGAVESLFYLDPADWGPSGVILRLHFGVQTETDPTDSTLQAQVARLTALGAAGTISTAAAVTTLSDVSMTPNAANTSYHDVGVDTTVTTAGWYFIAAIHNVNPAQAMTWSYTLLGRPAT